MTMTTSHESSPRPSTDVFSMTDDALASRYAFCTETGVGNWGSVWIGFDKRPSSSGEERRRVAIKVVHRTKTQTTAARIRALWNEMKVVKPFRDGQDGSHPSIVAFDCFIITPSYALIVMEYLPKLLPVKVEERIAKVWFASLASAVAFMHRKGVVHNDIKPANILLSVDNVPTFVDFGFAERYDLNRPVTASPAFRSSLAYGTPEYLSPERSRGLVHDTRKSDVWSLGVTFFEIVTGRTPFEHSHGEQFASKQELEVYWARTFKGEWLAAQELRKIMSTGLEEMLRRMLAPNADVRVTAEEVVSDPYWTAVTERKPLKSRPPTIVVEPAAPQNKLSSAVRSVLGSRSNLPPSSSPKRPPATKTGSLTANGNGSEKENVPPKLIRKKASKSVVKDSSITPPLPPPPSTQEVGVGASPLAVQEAAGNRVDRVAEIAQGALTRDPLSPLTSPFVRPRANDIFVPAKNPIGNTVDLNAPHPPPLRHAVSANYPFNAGAIDGVGKKVVVRAEVRRIKSDLARNQGDPTVASARQSSTGLEGRAQTHKKSPSYNSLYLGHNRKTSVHVIPEVHGEDEPNASPTPPKETSRPVQRDTEVYYERVLARSKAVEKVGRGYQSNVCTRNDPSTFKKIGFPADAVNGPISRGPPPSAYCFNTTRERLNPTRPQRKMRQAASFDGFASLRPRAKDPAKARPLSANFDAGPPPLSPSGKGKEKKKSTVTGAMRKALLALLGSGGDKVPLGT